MPGGYDPDGQKSRSNYKFYDIILQYDPDSDIWEVVGHMMVIRDSHAVTVMDSEEFSDYCDVTTGTSTAITTPNSDGGKSYVYFINC